jgi:Mg2+/Co2+ transporter CorB
LDSLSDGLLLGLLALLILLSGFFSASETGMMALNRYRLRHQAGENNRGAKRIMRLLERPDRLIGVILLGNNFVNILASSLATLLALRWMGEAGIPLAALILTLVILICSEVAPKTLAAIHPERIAYPASLVISPLLKLLYPLVWLINLGGNSLLWILGLLPKNQAGQNALSMDELRTVVREADGMIPSRHQDMLLAILDMEKVTVEDIMVPRNEIVGIDVNSSNLSLNEQLMHSSHTRLPLYDENIDNVIGIIHIRKVMRLFQRNEVDQDMLIKLARDPYFIPEGTPLNVQLLNFQRHKRRIGLVVNEYGDIRGLVTLEDILEEIVGEFTTDRDVFSRDIHPQDDGSFLVDASITLRELNKGLNMQLPTNGPKTLNGLILEHLEAIPEGNISLRLAGYPLEIIHVTNNSIKTVRIDTSAWQPSGKLDS